MQGINKVVYKTKNRQSGNSRLGNYEAALERAISAAEKMQELKEKGFKPDIIYGFAGWGSSMLIKDVFPEVPFICYCEWFLNPEGANIGFDGTTLSFEEKANLRCNNAHVLTTLSMADAGIAPTQWQKDQFPKDFHDKIRVIHDGVDTGLFVPDENVKFTIKSTMENGKTMMDCDMRSTLIPPTSYPPPQVGRKTNYFCNMNGKMENEEILQSEISNSSTLQPFN